MIRLLIAIIFVAAAVARADSTVAVMPFEVQGAAGNEWVGRAVQEGIATGLQKGSHLSGVIVAGIAPTDAGGAISMAKPANADAVIFGSVQIVDDQIRVLGQIILTGSGKSLGTLRCDASEREIFDAEDRLAAQAQRILTPVVAGNRPATHTAPPTIQLVGPTVSTSAPRYFGGDVMSEINQAKQYRDEYDRYYYYSADTAGCGWVSCFGAPCFGFGGGGFCGFGGAPSILPVVTPVHGW
jgi:TolB-like protein